MAERGQIRSLRYTRQRAEFTGLRFGTITPTDIDGLIEFEGRCCIFMEAKHGGAELPTGQRLALERNCDRWGSNGIVLVVHNESMGSEKPTYRIAELPVVEYRLNGQWVKPKAMWPCVRWVERFATSVLGREIRADIAAPPAVIAANDSRRERLSDAGGFASVTEIEVEF